MLPSTVHLQLRRNATAPPPPPPPAGKSRHVLFYRDILPPMVRVLAYGSAVYFAAHLAWTYLDAQEQRTLEAYERTALEKLVREKRLGEQQLDKAKAVADKVKGEAKGWWPKWLGGSA